MASIDLRALAGSLERLDFRELVRMESCQVGVFRSGAGCSPWEMHPDDDELLVVLEGRVEICWLTAEAEHEAVALPGHAVRIPKGCWHRHRSSQPWKEMYISPRRTEHSTAEDPRLEAARRSA